MVVGSGSNGLVGAIVLAEAGLDVELFEAEATIGGGTRSAELTLPGFVHDVCSAIHPLGRASPALRRLELDVDWIDPPLAAAHPLDDGTAVVLSRHVDETAESIGAADGEAYRNFVGPLAEHWPDLEDVVLAPTPRALLRATRALGPRRLERSLRGSLCAARTFAESLFSSERGRAFFAGHAAHSILPLERRPSAGFGLALAVLGHAVGWPLPRGGSQRIADALAAKLVERGGRIRSGSPVDGLPTADVVLCDVVPRGLLRLADFPTRYERALRAYRHGPGAFKVDWALERPIPWRAEECRRAGTVHLGGTLEEIAASERSAWEGRISNRPFVLLTQPSLFDPTRAPEGRHTAWAYCHVPNGSRADLTDRIEAQVERFAPGFREVILARSSLGPLDLEARNRNYVGGDVNGGAMDLAQLWFRPSRRLVPYRTPLRGVYICSSATPPGGGVHGMCGLAAATVALRDLGR